MVGSSIVTIPYAFYNSGLLVGLILTFLSFLLCMQSCIYISRTCVEEDDYYSTIRKYWGTTGFCLYYSGVIVILISSTTGYFIILT